jgi:sec-independent protein translocase protein TatC
MSFLGHIEALRWHLVRSVVVILVLAGFAFAYVDVLFSEIIFGPSREDFITFTFLCELSGKWGMDEALYGHVGRDRCCDRCWFSLFAVGALAFC